ncbi:hypothetical protein ACFQHV_08435 [Promicromonospora thailandica]|uniref:Uncharacterized protein n=1 Tax=Promicromonospora thailandica TaxID=765201 RepID=A0A9X2K021_9MICO|nr:hypothetical protein [Promicromonospora thailandica]MCP2266644.1 hypothetical protein [Promicromonospora thailandica]BFF17279.1 hypothetical protein GCM10025730_08000 [Promicromonospora thailandica]
MDSAPPGTPTSPQTSPQSSTRPRDVPAAGVNVLELRIHGIANTLPYGSLDLPREEVTQSDGDGLGSFWTPRPDVAARDRALPPGHVHAIRPDVRREAYSWGAMARLGGLPFGGVLGMVGRFAVRLLWAAMVPFGLANAAYWARRIPAPDPTAHGDRDGAHGTGSLRPEATAALTRVFSLGLTLLFVSAVATVALSIVGTRCMGLATVGPDSLVPVCARVPSWLYGLARLDVGDRLALLSVAPVLVVAVLVAVAHSGQVRFESTFSVMRAGGTVSPSGPPLHRAGFWSQRTGSGLLWAHLGAALALTGQYLTWTRYADVGLPVPGLPLFALVVILAACAFVALRTDDDGVQALVPRWKGRAGLALFAAGLLVWLVACWAASTGPQPERMPALVGLDLVPALLGVGLFGIAATGLAWRTARSLRGVAAWSTVPVVATACVAAVLVTEPGAPWRHLLVALAVLAVLSPAVVVLGAMVLRRRATEGWNGAGPGVFLLVSAAAAAVYSSLLVLGVQWFLRNGERVAPVPLGDGLVGIVRGLPDPELVRVPPVYTEFGTASVVIALVFLALLVVALAGPYVMDVLRSRTLWIPGAPGTLGPPYGPAAPAWRAVAEAPDLDGGPNPVLERVLRGRQVAAMSHRAELAVGALAAAAYVAALVAHIPLVAQHDDTGTVQVPAWLSSLAVPALGVLAATLVASALAGGTGGGPSRPWGLLWDLLCFLPRSAHPFGPPSYAERVVPEVRSRVDAWLTAADVADDAERARVAPDRRVVLSAHSMGGVLAAAVVLIRAGNPVPGAADGGTQPVGTADGRLGLLTYGVQLRPFFGRFFPDLLGPTTTGTPPSTGPAWSADPWGGQVRAAGLREAGLRERGSRAGGPGPGADPAAPLTPGRPEPGSGEQVTLMSLLTCGAKPAWVNLWRRTDFLGFPVVGYGENDTDRGAEEMDRSAYLFAVAAHSGYQSSWAYHVALDEVISRLTPAGPSGAQPAVTRRAGRG